MKKCKRCGAEMNPVEVMVSATHGVCGKCVRELHAEATGESQKK